MNVTTVSYSREDIFQQVYGFAGSDGAIPLSQTNRAMNKLFKDLIRELILTHFRCTLDPSLLPIEQYQQEAMIKRPHARSLCTSVKRVEGIIKNCTHLNAEGTKMIWGMPDGTMEVRDAIAGIRIGRRLRMDRAQTTSVQVNREGTRTVIGSRDGVIRV